MNVCIITSTFPTNETDPIGRFAYDFCLALSKKNNVTVITQKREQQYQLSQNFKLIPFDWRGKDIPLSNLKYYNVKHLFYTISLFINAKRALDNQVKSKEIDYCFALWAIPSGIGGYYLFRKYKIPFDIWCLGSDIRNNKSNPLTKSFLIRILKTAMNVYADGYNFCKDVEILSGRDCKFLPSGRRLKSFEQSIETKKTNKKTFIFIGRYHINKGPDVLLRAIPLLPKEINADCEFVFYGKGPLKEQLQNTAIKLNLENVLINDLIDTNHIAEAFSKSHFIIIPSRIDSIPVILSDALQAYTPMIGANVGDLGDVIKKQKIGYVFEKENVAELSQMIVKAFHDRKKDYSENIYKATQLFSVENAVDEFEQNLKTVT